MRVYLSKVPKGGNDVEDRVLERAVGRTVGVVEVLGERAGGREGRWGGWDCVVSLRIFQDDVYFLARIHLIPGNRTGYPSTAHSPKLHNHNGFSPPPPEPNRLQWGS